MLVKTMGSTSLYLTPSEAAEVLGVTESMVRVYDRRQLLEGHYPEGKKVGKRYLAEDVHTLAEIRGEHNWNFARKLPSLAMKAVATSRRVERKLDEIMSFLGLNDVVLSLEKHDIINFHQEVELNLNQPMDMKDEKVIVWAKRLLAINEEYLELVKSYVGTQYPWKPYLDLARTISCKAGARPRMYIEHARSNLRNVAYFYERSFRGTAEAEKMFPGERFSGKLLARILPTA